MIKLEKGGDIIKTKAKRKKKRNKKQKNLLPLLLGVIASLVVVVIASMSIMKDFLPAMATKLTKDNPTFNYTTEKENDIITLTNNYKLSDNVGKKLSSNTYDFKISKDKKDIKKSYEVIIVKVASTIDDKYIKFYLTDTKNNLIDGFRQIKTYSDLDNSVSDSQAKVLYKGILDEESEISLRLRFWLSNKYEKDDKTESFSFKVKVVPLN